MKNIFTLKFIRFSAAATFVVFLINSAAWGQVSTGFRPSEIKQDVSLAIPAELGRVIETETASAAEPLLIHIQDAHANYAAQQNMAKILDYLVREKKIRTVFVEGALGELDARHLKFSEDHQLNRKIAERLARDGEMTAADLYLFDHPDGVDFIGIENPDLYRADLDLFRKVMRRETESREWIRSSQNALERDLTRSVNKDLLAALRIYLHEDENTSSLMKVLGTLEMLSERHLGRDLRNAKEQKEFPNLVRLMRLKVEKENLDQAKVAAEQKEIETLAGNIDLEHGNPRFELERVYAKLKSKAFEFSKYPNFTRFTKRLIYERELDSTLLFEERDRWLELLMNSLAQTSEEKTAVERVKQAKLKAKLLLLELTRKDWQEASLLPVSPETVDAVAFYQKAQEREAAFFETIQQTLKARHESRAVVITGGFHTDALKNYFNVNRTNYSVIMPEAEGDSRAIYVKALLGTAPKNAMTSDLAINPQSEPPALALKMGIDVRERKAEIARAASLGAEEEDLFGSEEQPAAASQDLLTIGADGFLLQPRQETIVHAGKHYFYVSYNQIILLKDDFSPIKTIPLSGNINIEADKFWATDSDNLDLVQKFLKWKELKKSVLLGAPFGNRAGRNGGMYFINVQNPKTKAVKDVIGLTMPGDVRRAVVKFSKGDVNRTERYQMMMNNWEKLRDFMAVTVAADKQVFDDLGVRDDGKETYVQQPVAVLTDLIRGAKTLEEKKYLIDRFISFVESFWGAGFMDMDLRPDNCGFNKDGQLVIHDFDYTMTMEEFKHSKKGEKVGVFVNYIINNASLFEELDPALREYFIKKIEAVSFMKEILNESKQESQFDGTFKNYILEDSKSDPEAYEKAVQSAREHPLLALIRWGVQKNREIARLLTDQKRYAKNASKVAELEEKIQGIAKEQSLEYFGFFNNAVQKRDEQLVALFEGIKNAEKEKGVSRDTKRLRTQDAAFWSKLYSEPYRHYPEDLALYTELTAQLGEWTKSPVLNDMKPKEEEELKNLVQLRERLSLISGQQVFVGKKVPRFQMLDQNPTMADYHFVVVKLKDPDNRSESLHIMDLDVLENKPSITNIFQVAPLGTYKFQKHNQTFGDTEEVPLAQWGVGTVNIPQPDAVPVTGATGTAQLRSTAYEDEDNGLGWLNDIEAEEVPPSYSVIMRTSAMIAFVKKQEEEMKTLVDEPEESSESVTTLSSNPFGTVDKKDEIENPLLKAIDNLIENNHGKLTFSNDKEMKEFSKAVASGLEQVSPIWKKELDQWKNEINALDIKIEDGAIRVANRRRKADPVAKVFPGFEFVNGKWIKYFVQVTGDASIGQAKYTFVKPFKQREGKTTWVPVVQPKASSLGSEKPGLVEGRSLGEEKDQNVSIPANGILMPADKEAILSAGNSTFYVNADRVALIAPDPEQKNLLQVNAVPFTDGTFWEREKSGAGKQIAWSTSESELEKIYKFFEWKTLGTNVVLKKPHWAGRGANGVALDVLVQGPKTSALCGVLGQTRPDQVSKVYLKVSAKNTTRDEVFDEISKPGYEQLRKFMAKTERLTTEAQFREVGLKMPENYETKNKVYVQQPVVVLSDVIREAKNLDTQKFLIDQFVDRVEAFWRAGFIDMDSRPDNWGFNDVGELVFHDFDYTLTNKHFNNPETYKKFNMSELDFKAQLFANYVVNNAAAFYHIDPQLTDYFLSRISMVPFINDILKDCESSDDPARFKRLMGLVKAWNAIKTQKEKLQVIFDVVEYFKAAVIERKDVLAASFLQVPARPIKDSEQTSIDEQKKRLAAQWAKKYIEPYQDYDQQAKRYEELKNELSGLVDSEALNNYGLEELRISGILLNKAKELEKRFQHNGLKFIFVGDNVPQFQMRVDDSSLDEFHFVVIKGKDQNGNPQLMIMDYTAMNEGDGKSKTQIMALNPKGSLPIFTAVKVPDPQKGYVTKLEPVKADQPLEVGTMQPQDFTMNNDEDLFAELGIEILSEEGKSFSSVQSRKPATAIKINTFDIQGALAGWEEESAADSEKTETKKIDAKQSGEFRLPAAISSDENSLAEVKKDIVAANAQSEDARLLIRKAKKKGYQLVIWKDLSKISAYERTPWLRNLDFNISKLDTLYQDWVVNHAPLTLYADDAGIWVQGNKSVPGERLTFEAFEFDGKKWEHVYFKFIAPPGLDMVQRIVVEPMLEGGKIILRKKNTARTKLPVPLSLTEKPEKDETTAKWLDVIAAQGSPLAKKFAHGNATLGWFKTLIRESAQNRYSLDVALDLKEIGDKQKVILETAVSKLSDVSEELKKGKNDSFLTVHVQEIPFGIQIPCEKLVVNDIYLKGYQFNPAENMWQPFHALKWPSKDGVVWKPMVWDPKTQAWTLKGSSLGAAAKAQEEPARNLYQDLLGVHIVQVQKLQEIIRQLENEDGMVRVQALREMRELGKQYPSAFNENVLGRLLVLLSPQNTPNTRKTAQTAMEVFGETNPKAFTEKNSNLLDQLLPERGYRSDRHNIIARFKFYQKKAQAQAHSLGQTSNFQTQLDRVTDPEVILHVAIEAADHLLYQGDLTHEGWLNRALGMAEAKAEIAAPRVEVPLAYLLARLGVSAEELKRRAVVVTQDLVKNPEVRDAILDTLKKGDRVIAVKNPILESEKYYDQFLKAARTRGIEIIPFTNVSGIRAVELERRLRNIQDSFSAESAADPNSIPLIKKDHFSRFKIDEAILNRGNVSVKLAMETIMALSLVDQESVYKAAGFSLGKEDGFWHVDNSFVAFMHLLSQEYQADQLQKKAA